MHVKLFGLNTQKLEFDLAGFESAYNGCLESAKAGKQPVRVSLEGAVGRQALRETGVNSELSTKGLSGAAHAVSDFPSPDPSCFCGIGAKF